MYELNVLQTENNKKAKQSLALHQSCGVPILSILGIFQICILDFSKL